MADVQETSGQEPEVTTNDDVEQVEQVSENQDSQQNNGDSEDGEVQDTNTNDQPDMFERKYVEQLRDEAAGNRKRAKELEESVAAATSEKDDLIQKIGKAFGFIKDEDSEAADANKIVEQLTSERDSTAKELRDLKEENALNKAIKGHGADDSLTIAYLRGTGALADLDPAAENYTDQVSQVVQEAVTSNPKLAAQAAVRQSSVDTTNTNTEQVTQIAREDLAKMSASEINKAHRDGKLNHLLT